MERAERLKRRVLSQPRVVTTATALWTAIRRALVTSLADPDSAVRARAHSQLDGFSARLAADEGLRGRLDGYAADLAAFVVNTYGNEITTVITETVDRWDGDEAARRIELHVGRDLQFIRINGTLVGGLAGLVIHAVSQSRDRPAPVRTPTPPTPRRCHASVPDRPDVGDDVSNDIRHAARHDGGHDVRDDVRVIAPGAEVSGSRPGHRCAHHARRRRPPGALAGRPSGGGPLPAAHSRRSRVSAPGRARAGG